MSQYSAPAVRDLRPRIVVFGVGGAGGNAVNNMIASGASDHAAVVQNVLNELLAGWVFEVKREFGGELEKEVTRVLGAPSRSACAIPLWDGRTAARVVASLGRRAQIASS